VGRKQGFAYQTQIEEDTAARQLIRQEPAWKTIRLPIVFHGFSAVGRQDWRWQKAAAPRLTRKIGCVTLDFVNVNGRNFSMRAHHHGPRIKEAAGRRHGR